MNTFCLLYYDCLFIYIFSSLINVQMKRTLELMQVTRVVAVFYQYYVASVTVPQAVINNELSRHSVHQFQFFY